MRGSAVPCKVDGMSVRQAAREFGLSRKDDPEDAGVLDPAWLSAEEAEVVAGTKKRARIETKCGNELETLRPREAHTIPYQAGVIEHYRGRRMSPGGSRQARTVFLPRDPVRTVWPAGGGRQRCREVTSPRVQRSRPPR